MTHTRFAAMVARMMVMCILAAAPAMAGEIVDRVVAVVNDDPITLSELNRELKPYVERIEKSGYAMDKQRQLLFKIRADIINQLINRKLTDQEIARYGVSASDEEVDATIERIKESAFSTEEDMRAALKNEGMTFDEYRSRIRQQVLRRKLVNAEVRSRTVITDEEIKAYYDSHEALFAGETKYHLKHILVKVPPGADEDQKHAVRLQMEGLYQALSDGRSFDELMQAVSQTGADAVAGDLGQFEAKSLSEQLQTALEGKKRGEYTGVLETDIGFQIVYLEDVVRSPGKPLEEVSKSIEETLFNEIVDKKFESWLEKLKKRSYIKVIQ